jgi:hypothetical protein
MRRSVNLLAVCLFLLGFLIAPAVHVVASGHDRNACGDRAGHDHKAPGPHRADQCGICQLAHTPVALTTPVAAPSVVAVKDELSVSPVATPAQRLAHILPFSCGPPA